MVVFFDIDGTLLDQRKAESYAAARFLETYGDRFPRCPTPPEFCSLWRRLREKQNPAFLTGAISSQEKRRLRMRELFSETEPRLSDADVDERVAIYAEHYRLGWTLFDDVRPCLDVLAASSPLGIISNGSYEQQVRKLRHTGILERFEVIAISEDVGAAKPDRAIFQDACLRARCAPREGVHVGDRLDLDAQAGCQAGLRGIWLDRAHVDPPAPVERIRALTDLRPLLV
jgi:putative hydrolase of the HAD superfamily